MLGAVRLRRALAFGILALSFAATSCVAPGGGGGADNTRLNQSATGKFKGEAPFDFNGCGDIHQRFALTVSTHLGPAKNLDMDGCVFASEVPTYDGTFTYTFPDGVLNGTVAGTLFGPLDSAGNNTRLQLTVDSGTGAVCNVVGSLRVTGHASSPTPPQATFSVVGDVTSSLGRDPAVTCP